MGFYFRWKYPNTTRRVDRVVFFLLLGYVPIYFFFIAPKNPLIKSKDLTVIHGTIQSFKFPRSSSSNIATLVLNEYPRRLYSFDMRGYYVSHAIKYGDSATLLVSRDDFRKNLNEIRSFELIQNRKQIFTVSAYNASINDDIQIYRIFLWIVIVIIVLYIIADRMKLIIRVKKLLDSPDPKFRPESEELNFNEFLDR